MSAKTKIVVLKMKELIFTGILALLILLLIILFLAFVFPKETPEEEITVPTSKYSPGVYTSTVMLGDTAADVQVIVDENHINSVALINLSETAETMYPLVKPAMEDLSSQILDTQSLEDITYSQNSQYTSIVLMNAIQDAIEKASLE